MARTHRSFLVLVATLLLFPLAASAASKKSGTLTEAVTGSFSNAAGKGSFRGQLTVNRVANQGGKLVAIGSLDGTLTDAAGKVLGRVTGHQVTLPVQREALHATCDILHLGLGSLDLDLLGLTVHLDPVVLDIAAQSGSGKLLGNLLCGLSKLLDSSADLTAIANKINKVLETAA